MPRSDRLPTRISTEPVTGLVPRHGEEPLHPPRMLLQPGGKLLSLQPGEGGDIRPQGIGQRAPRRIGKGPHLEFLNATSLGTR